MSDAKDIFVPRELLDEAEAAAAEIYRAGYEAGFVAAKTGHHEPRWCVSCNHLIPQDRLHTKTNSCSEKCRRLRIAANQRRNYRGQKES